MKITILIQLWLTRFALSQGFVWGSTGKKSWKSYYYNYSQVLKKFPYFHTAVLQYSKYSRYPKKSAILSVFAVFAIFPVSGKSPVSIIFHKDIHQYNSIIIL